MALLYLDSGRNWMYIILETFLIMFVFNESTAMTAIVVFHTGIILLSTKTFTAVSLYLYKRCFCGKPSKETKLNYFFFLNTDENLYAMVFFKEMLILCTDSIRKCLLWVSLFCLTYFTTRTLAGQKVQSQVFYSQSEKTEGYANINIFQIIYCVKCIWGTENCIKCDAQKFDVILKRGFTFLNLILKPSEQLNMKSFMIFKWIFRVGMH